MITVLVLAGLWLMHGASADTGAGCHAGAMPLIAAMSGGRGAMAAPAEASAGSRNGASASPAGMNAGQLGELCLSAQPPDPGTALIGLIALMALTRRVLPGSTALARVQAASLRTRRRRGPPGRWGVALLAAVCVSRT